MILLNNKTFTVWLSPTKAFKYTTLNDALNIYAKLPNSVMVEQLDNESYLMISRRFEMPITCNNYYEVRNTLNEVF